MLMLFRTVWQFVFGTFLVLSLSSCDDLAVMIGPPLPGSIDKVSNFSLTDEGLLALDWQLKPNAPASLYQLYLLELPEDDQQFFFTEAALTSAPLTHETMIVPEADSPRKKGILIEAVKDLNYVFKDALEPNRRYLLQLVERGRRINRGREEATLLEVKFKQFAATSAIPSNDSVELVWDAIPGANRYEVYADEAGEALLGTTLETRLVVPRVPGESTVTYYVRAFRGQLAAPEIVKIKFSTSSVKVSRVRSLTPDGKYTVGKVLDFEVEFTEDVNFFGGGALPLQTNAHQRSAAYVSGNGTKLFHFSYTIQDGDDVLDLQNGTILAGDYVDSLGLSVAAVLPVMGSNLSLSESNALSIDTLVPSSPVSVGFASAFSGSGNLEATWTSSADTYFIHHNVKLCPDSSCSVGCLASSSVVLAQKSFTGVAEGLYHACVQGEDSTGLKSPWIASLLAARVDTSAPTVVRVASVTANGHYKETQTVELAVTFSEPVFVVNPSQLTLKVESGAVDRDALYASGSGSQTLHFIYSILNGDSSADLNYESVAGLSVGSGSIRDSSGNSAELQLPALLDGNALAQQSDLVIDTTVPTSPSAIAFAGPTTATASFPVNFNVSTDANFKYHRLKLCLINDCSTGCTAESTSLGSPATVSGVDGVSYFACVRGEDNVGHLSAWISSGSSINVDTSFPSVLHVTSGAANGLYAAGANIPILVRFSEPVTVTNGASLRLELETGTTNYLATLSGGSGTNTLTFTYTVQAGDNTLDLDYISPNALTLNGATIADANSNAANVTLPALGDSNSLGSRQSIAIDTANPTDPAAVIFANPQSNSLSFGVSWSASSDAHFAHYNLMLCSANDCSTGCSSVSTSSGISTSLSAANGSTSYACVQAEDQLGQVSAWVPSVGTITVDNSAPTITNVTSPAADAIYELNDVVNIQVVFSELVNVTASGELGLLLETGTTDRTATYASGTGTNTLVFQYTVQAGDNSNDLAYTSTGALTRGTNGLIRDAAGNNANLTLPATGGGASLSGQKNIKIDTTAPSNPSGVNLGATVSSLASFSMSWTASTDANFLTHNLKLCSSNDCSTSCTAPLSSVASPQTMTGLNGSTYYGCVQGEDAIGLSSNWIASTGTILIDTAPPSVTNVSSAKTDAAYRLGEIIDLSVVFSENVWVTTPAQLSLTLETGATDRLASYVSGSGSNTLVFRYTVQAGDTSADLDYPDDAALAVGTGFIKDQAGLDALLTLPAVGGVASIAGQKSLVIDTSAPAAPLITAPAALAFEVSDVTIISGTSEADADIELKNGATVIGTTTAVGTNWSITLGSPLSDGTYTLNSNATDAAGNTSVDSADHTFTVDTSTPNPPVITTLTTPTLDQTPTISGTSEAEMFIRIYADAVEVGSTTADSFGAWTLTTSSLAEGTYAMTATARDDGNRTSAASAAVSLNVDLSDPVDPSGIVFPVGLNSSSTSLVMNWTNSSDLNFKTHNIKLCAASDCTGCIALATDLASPATLLGVDTETYYGCVQGEDHLGHTSDWIASAQTVTVSATEASVTSVSATTANGYYNAGDLIEIVVNFSKPIFVTNGPDLTLELETGTSDRLASFVSSSGSSITFSYTVQAGDTAASLDYTSPTALALGTGTIKDVANADAVLTLPPVGGASSLAGLKDIVIDTTLPVAPSNLGFAGTTSNSLTFPMNWTNATDTNLATHNVKLCESNDCATSCTTPLTSAGTPRTMTGVNGVTYYGCAQGEDSAGQLSVYVASLGTIRVDTALPVVENVSSSQANGSYKAGTAIVLLVEFSETVVVTAGNNIKLLLETGATDYEASYTGGSGTDTLSFEYIVQAGDVSADLNYVNTNSLTAIATGAIRDDAGNLATLSLPAPGDASSLGGQKNIIIDTAAPAAPAIVSPAHTDFLGSDLTVVSGTSEANANIDLRSGGVSIGTVTATGTNWSITLALPLGDGTYDLTALATDAAGNVSVASSTNSITVDNSPPNAPVISALTSPTLDPTPAVSGTSEPGVSITVYAGLTAVGTTAADGSGNWSLNLDSLVDATYTLTAKATDLASRESAASAGVSLNVDTSNPSAPSNVAFSSSFSPSTSLGITWTNSTDVNFSTHNLMLCPDNLCSAGCTSEITDTASGGTLTGVNGQTYYACVQGVDSLGHLSVWVASAATGTVDTTEPSVTDVTSSLANGYYPAGSVIPIDITFSEDVIVANGPALGLVLETGTSDRTAVYASGSGSDVLTFNYTVQATDTTSDLNYLSTTALSVGAGSIKDSAGNDAVLTLPALGDGHSLAIQKSIVIDTTAPAAPSGVGFSAATSNTLTFSMGWTNSTDTNFQTHNVKICTQSDCATGCSSLLTANNSPRTMTGVNGVTYYGCVQGQDLAGLSSSFINSAGTIRVDTTDATVLGVSSTLGNGAYKAGVSIPITIQFSEPVLVTNGNELSLTLATGGTQRLATYVSGSNSDTLIFTYAIQAGDIASDLDYVATSSLSLGSGGQIKDVAGNDSDLTLAAPGAAGSLGNAKNLIVDTVAPAAPLIVTPVNGDYSTSNVTTVSGTSDSGNTIIIYKGGLEIGTGTAVGTNWTVTLDSALTNGSHTISATASDAASNVSTVSANTTFVVDTIPPVAPVITSSGIVTNDNTPTVSGTSEPNVLITLYLAGTTARGTTTADGSGNWSLSSLTLADGSRSITATATDQGSRESAASNAIVFTIDTALPTISSVTSTTADGTYGINASINVQITFNEAVTFTANGSHYLTLEGNGTDVNALLTSGSGTTQISGTFLVPSGMSSADLEYKLISSLAGTYTDAAGNASANVLPTKFTANSIGGQKAIVIDGIPATVSNVTSAKANGAYGPGHVIDIALTFSKVVTVLPGNPTVTLNTAPVRTASYVSGSGSTTLNFTYTVQSGDVQADLNASSLNLTTGTIRDSLGNNATLTLPSSGAAGSLDLNKNLQIAGNSIAPTLSSTPASQNGFSGTAITSVNTNAVGATDLDVDGQAVTYACRYDTTINSGMDSGGTDCASLPNTAYSFNTSTGVLTWTPSAAAVASLSAVSNYEFRITGTDTTNLTGTSYFTVSLLTSHTATIAYDGSAAQYTFDANLIDFSGGFARLKAIDQTDDDNTATGFDGGVHNGTKWYITPPYFERLDESTSGCDGRYNACASSASETWLPRRASMVGHYSFESNYQGWVPGSGGTNPARTTDADKIGLYGLEFSGTTNHLEKAADSVASFTISLWFKTTLSFSNGTACNAFWQGTAIVSADVAAGGSNDWGVTLCDGYIIAGVGNPEVNVRSAYRYNDGKWHHLVFSRNKTTGLAKIWVDGFNAGDMTGNTNNLNANPNWNLGATNSGNFKFVGMMDEVITWSVELTNNEVYDLYDRQVAKFSGSMTSRVFDAGVAGASWTTFRWLTTKPFGKELPDFNASLQHENSSDYSTLNSNTMMNNLVGLWHLNEDSWDTAPGGTDFRDDSGNGNHGVIRDTVYIGGNGRFDKAPVFTTEGDINLGTSATLDFGTSAFTMSFWFRTSIGNAWIFGNKSAVDANGVDVFMEPSGRIVFGVGCGGQAASECVYVATSGQYKDGDWHHVVLMNDKDYDVLKIFVDGRISNIDRYLSWGGCATPNGSNEMNFSACTHFNGNRSGVGNILGGSAAGGRFPGFIDEFAIWKRRMNNDQVRELYRRGANRLLFQVRTCPDAACSGVTWKGPNGTERTFFSEINNNSVQSSATGFVLKTAPNLTFSNFPSLTLANNRYFQYRYFMESDDTASQCGYAGGGPCSAELDLVEIGPLGRYPPTSPSISNNVPLPFYSIGGGGGLTQTATCAGGVAYQLSVNGSTWFYWTGAAWALSNGTVAQSNPIATINTNASSFAAQVGRTNLYVKALLGSNGSQTCELDTFSASANNAF